MVEHLYVHIPFCPKVCPYCSFYKEASDRNKTRRFLESVLAEAERHAEIVRPVTIFFGGGTPTALSTLQLDELISGLRGCIDFSGLQEFTIEMNPATVSLEKALALRGLGVNRVSMGVQSWDPGLLHTLGRVHSAAQARRSYEILREAGFSNINLDLIYGVPGQTIDVWRQSINETVALAPDHISAYCLTYEEDTEFFLRLQKGEFRPDIESDAALFEETSRRLPEAGYDQYEISNFAPPGRECLHNLAYWQGRDYLGLGPSAFSTVGGRRWKNISDTATYIARIADTGGAEDFSETLDEPTRRAERAAFGLRTRFGVESALLEPTAADELRALGLLREQSGRHYLTERGKLLADEIATRVIY